MDFNPANQQLLRWYGKCYHSLNDTMLLDTIKPQVQNKLPKYGVWHLDYKVDIHF